MQILFFLLFLENKGKKKIKCLMAARWKARNIFALSNIWIMGSNPTREGMDVCPPLLSLYYSVDVAALPQSDPPSKKF
jgi:hypothetical protein